MADSLKDQALKAAERQQAGYISSLKFAPLDVSTSAEPPASESQNQEDKDKTPASRIQLKEHKLDDGSSVFQISFDENLPGQFTLNSDEKGLPHFYEAIRPDTRDTWQVGDFRISADLKREEKFFMDCKKSELEENWQTLLPGVGETDGVNLRLVEATVADSQYQVFLAKVYDPSISTTGTRLKSAFLTISKAPEKP